MRNLTKMMIAGAAAAVLSSMAYSSDCSGNRCLNGGWTDSVANGQRNLNTVLSRVDVLAGWVGGDMDVSSVAVGNNFSADLQGQDWISNDQTQLADVKAVLNANIGSIAGDATFTATAICNNASIKTKSTGTVETGSIQRCDTLDPAAYANLTVGDSVGNISLAATAVGNNLSIDSQTGRLDALNLQANASSVNAGAYVNAADIAGDLNVSATAIGNNANIVSRFQTP